MYLQITEAVALKSIDVEHVAEELIPLFARVGVPREILTDQGSNFTSRLLEELYRLLHVRPIRTSPCISPSNGWVGRAFQWNAEGHAEKSCDRRGSRLG